jgi:hypothetical protein
MIILYPNDFQSYATHSHEGYNHDRDDIEATPFRQMEKSQHRFVFKFFFLESLDSKAIHKELTAVLESITYL